MGRYRLPHVQLGTPLPGRSRQRRLPVYTQSVSRRLRRKNIGRTQSTSEMRPQKKGDGAKTKRRATIERKKTWKRNEGTKKKTRDPKRQHRSRDQERGPKTRDLKRQPQSR
ncbi:hypothetical protein NDU88_002345 [Pleurodeles waltl]|uniref:Uncharacterized protein n=1 Tax=Pleurodeles waltl TaxID=8319 RepID=A0AAV7NDR8_PLEWA|nr:hypothetical protein NDU88_002345 [Pleurodeles waltl]